LLPIFVLSKLELLKIKSSLFYIVEKKLKIWGEDLKIGYYYMST
jgi:hypothetical protein